MRNRLPTCIGLFVTLVMASRPMTHQGRGGSYDRAKNGDSGRNARKAGQAAQ